MWLLKATTAWHGMLPRLARPRRQRRRDRCGMQLAESGSWPGDKYVAATLAKAAYGFAETEAASWHQNEAWRRKLAAAKKTWLRLALNCGSVAVLRITFRSLTSFPWLACSLYGCNGWLY